MTNMIYTAMPALPKKHHTNAVVLPSEWNTCPLSSIVEEISETVGTRKIETISISAGIGFVNQAEKFGRELSGKQYEKYIVLHKGDFSYNKGNSNIYPQGCIYRLNNRTEAAVPNVFENFRVSVGNPDYYEQLFLSGFLNRQLYSKINRGVRDNGLLNLKGKDFYSCEVPYPPLAEQERIAEILIQCDRVIEVKEQKLDELKQLKKEFLRKMFPAKGCDTPEIRFPGFTGAWEQRKLGDVCEIKDSARIPNSEWTESGVPYIRASDVTNENIDGVLFISQERYEFYKNRTGAPTKDDVLFNGGGEIGKCLLIADENPIYVQGGAVLYACTSESSKLVGQYLKIYFETTHAKSYIDTASAGGTMKHFTLKPSQMMPILIPSVDEQEKLGTYFFNLDHLITLHQRELEETKTYKKTLAKLLLTGIVRVQG